MIEIDDAHFELYWFVLSKCQSPSTAQLSQNIQETDVRHFNIQIVP